MSFAIFQTGGKQYKVVANEILKIERLNLEEGKKIEFKDILAYGSKDQVEIGSPTIKGAKIEAQVLKNIKNKTVLVFKKRRRKNSRKKYGHRQPLSLIKIIKIISKDGKTLEVGQLPKKAIKNIAKKTLKENKPVQTKNITKDIKKKTVPIKKKW